MVYTKWLIMLCLLAGLVIFGGIARQFYIERASEKRSEGIIASTSCAFMCIFGIAMWMDTL